MSYEYKEAYRNDLNRIERGISATAVKVQEEWKMRQYCFAYANFKALMPEIVEGRRGEDVFVEMLKIRPRTPLDHKYLEKIEEITFSGDYERIVQQRGGPFIFCSYHLGSYRKIVSLLASRGYDFTLIVDQGVYDNQRAESEGLVKAINERYGVCSDFQVLNAENFGAAMTMVKHLQEGKSLVAYIDGNRGTGGTPKAESQVLKIGFMNQEIYVRQGLAHISYVTGIPIVPVISYRKTPDNITLHFYPQILPKAGESRRAYCLQTTEKLYGYLETNLKQYPLQWEGWLYIHKYLDTKPLVLKKEATPTPVKTGKRQLEFNRERYGLYHFGQEWHLFDSDTYQTFIIPETVFRWFEQVMKGGLESAVSESPFGKAWRAQLQAQQILI
ncbi:MAG: hypothetical protein HUU01_04535 [Saprospiraceae bacterium]|nr:hypothetical protein [Saprospiraceae bacterium]